MLKRSLDVVIVNWNSNYHLEKCIKSILKYPNKSLDKIIIIDNNSNDDSLKFLNLINNKKITLLKNSKNLGFAKACNQGSNLANSKNDYILFLNPDIILSEKVLDKSVSFMEKKSSKNIGIFGITLLDSKTIAKTCRRFPTLKNLFADCTGISKVIKKTGCKMNEWDHKSSKRVDQIIGAYFLIRKNLFKELKGFDERFFVYFEEVDLSYRAKINGYSSYFSHKLKSIHYGGGCTERIKSKRLYLSSYSRLLYFKKYHNKFKFLLAAFLIILIEPVSRLFFLIIKLNIFDIKDLIKGYRELYFNVIKKRLLF